MTGIHLIEPTGHGGIFQHTARLGEILAEAGYAVTIHTTAACEPVQVHGVSFCFCSPWRRRGLRRRSAAVPIAARYCRRTVPHLIDAVGDGDVAHVQGAASAALTAFTVLGLHANRRPIVFSPHNTFARDRSRAQLALIRWCTRRADANVAFSQYDIDVLESWGAKAFLSPLVQLVPEPDPALVERWRQAWVARAGEQVVLFAGHIFGDKRLDLLVESAAHWPANRMLAVVGEDRGDWGRCHRLAAERGVDIKATLGFLPLDQFTAAIAAADVVVSPYERASQSGVLVLARELGVPTVASRVGGLHELCTEAVPPGNVAALTSAIDRVVADRHPPPRELDQSRALEAHLQAYGEHIDRRRGPGGGGGRVDARPPVAFVAWTSVRSRAKEFAAALGGEAAAYYDLRMAWRPLVPVRYAISTLRTLAYLLRRRPRAVIVTLPPIFPALLAYLYAQVYRAPLVLDSHPSAFGLKNSPLQRAFLPVHAWLARRASTTIVGAEDLASRVRSWGARADVVHEAPPLWETPPARPVDRAHPRVLWVGIFAPDEPIEEVIGAAELLPSFQFELTGDTRRIPGRLREGAPENVTFTGFLDGGEYGRAIDRADVILALTTDPHSAMRAACEAVYAGRPLVMSDWPEFGEMFSHAVTVTNDARGIADGLSRAVESHDELRASAPLAHDRQAARWAEQFDRVSRRLRPDRACRAGNEGRR